MWRKVLKTLREKIKKLFLDKTINNSLKAQVSSTKGDEPNLDYLPSIFLMEKDVLEKFLKEIYNLKKENLKIEQDNSLLLGEIAHSLRNSFNAVLSSSGLLLEKYSNKLTNEDDKKLFKGLE